MCGVYGHLALTRLVTCYVVILSLVHHPALPVPTSPLTRHTMTRIRTCAQAVS